MKYYIEVTFIDHPNLTLYQQWAALYTQLHLALVEFKDSEGQVPFGISYPQYLFNPEKYFGFLGSKLRIFATDEVMLKQLNLPQWLERLTDYVHISNVRAVPEQTGYAIYRRKQFKSSAERLAARRLKHDTGMSFEQAVAHYVPKLKQTALPYIQLRSLTNDHLFKLFIEKTVVIQQQTGKFSSYGLSPTSTVPDF